MCHKSQSTQLNVTERILTQRSSSEHYKQKNAKKQLIDEMKNSEIFKSMMDKFPDAELIDVNSKKDGVNND